jgi:hypothetical protein
VLELEEEVLAGAELEVDDAIVEVVAGTDALTEEEDEVVTGG